MNTYSKLVFVAVLAAFCGPSLSWAQKASSSFSINGHAETLCSSLPIECKDIIVGTFQAWGKEAIDQSVGNMNAQRKFAILFSKNSLIATDTERMALFEEVLNDDAFSNELGTKLNSEFLTQKDIILPKLDAEGVQSIASDVALNIITELAIISLVDYKESSGDENAAYWIRTVTKPSIDIITLSKGLAAGTVSLTAASFSAGAIWAKNIYSFTLLGARLNADEAAGRDVSSQLKMIAEQNFSIVESLRSGETRGVIFESVLPPQNLTQKQKDILEDQLIINNDYQIELLKSQANLGVEIFGWNVVEGAKNLAAKLGLGVPLPVSSGLEHAESTPSLPGDIKETLASQPKLTKPMVVSVEKDKKYKPNGGLIFNYAMYEKKRLEVDGKDCHIYAPYEEPTGVKWSGSCVDSLPVGEGRILWMKDDQVIWIDDVGEEHGMVFHNGKLYIYKDLSDANVQYTCEGDGNIFKKALVHVPKGTKRELFRNTWLVSAVTKSIVEVLVEKCPVTTPSWRRTKTPKYSDALIEIRIPGIEEKHDQGTVKARSQGETLSWRNFENLAVKGVEDDISDENRLIRDEENRIKNARQQKIAKQRQEAEAVRREIKQKEAQAQATEVQRVVDAEIAVVEELAKRLLNDGLGTPEELAIALQMDEKRTLQVLEDGLELDLDPVTGVTTVNHDGTKYYAVSYQPASLIENIIRKHRAVRMEQNFSWSDWIDATSSQGAERKLDLTCLYPDISDIPEKPERVGTRLRSFSTQGQRSKIILDCNFGWFD